MPAIVCSLGAFTVASIFYTWRALFEAQFKKEQQLRQRVAYMLWIMTTQA
jgi:hypothetical protein